MPVASERPSRVFEDADRELESKSLPAAIALGSFSALALELSLTRLFSVLLFYHFAFLAISIALLGLGAGGVFAHLFKRRLDCSSLGLLARRLSLLIAAWIPVMLAIVLHVPVSLELTAANFMRLTLVYLCSAVPFFLTGMEFSIVFARKASRIPALYGADLTGGAAACLAIVPLIDRMGAPNAILFAALTSAVASYLWTGRDGSARLAVAVSLALVVLMALNQWRNFMDVVWAKGIRHSNVEFARWNAISRVEVDRQPDGARVIKIDADAGTHIMHADPAGLMKSNWGRSLMTAPAAVVNSLRPHADYAIIGPGGGVDVLRALASGSPRVTGIEINPIIANTLMRGRYADYAYHLYERPQVRMEVGDGRSFIRHSDQSFDVIQMTLVDTWAATAAGAFALSENNLYTTDAFREYFKRLRPEGILAITRWEFKQPREALRVVSVAIEALHEMGVRDTRRHFIVVSYGQLDEDGIPVCVLAKKTAFRGDEEDIVARHLGNYPPLEFLYAPSTPLKNAFTALLESDDPAAFSRSYDFNVAPVSDNSPFFFFTVKPGRTLRLASSQEAMDWKVNLGVAVLGMLVVLSLAAVVAFLVVPLALEGKVSSDIRVGALVYFVAIGLGYILVEITFIQRFVLFLGHPTYALTVVVFLMLVASGAGSLASGRWPLLRRHPWVPFAAILTLLTTLLVALPMTLERLVGVNFPGKLLVSAALLLPAAVAMGMPFPVGLRTLAETSPSGHGIEWAWAMNAAASVLGSVLAIVIALGWGLNATLAAAVIAYLAALLLRGQLSAAAA